MRTSAFARQVFSTDRQRLTQAAFAARQLVRELREIVGGADPQLAEAILLELEAASALAERLEHIRAKRPKCRALRP